MRAILFLEPQENVQLTPKSSFAGLTRESMGMDARVKPGHDYQEELAKSMDVRLQFENIALVIYAGDITFKPVTYFRPATCSRLA